MLERADTNELTASGYFFTGAGWLYGFLLGTDGVNDPQVTITDGVTGNEIVPTNTYSASQKGLNGVMFAGFKRYCSNGAYCAITCAGAVEVVGFYRKL